MFAIILFVFLFEQSYSSIELSEVSEKFSLTDFTIKEAKEYAKQLKYDTDERDSKMTLQIEQFAEGSKIFNESIGKCETLISRWQNEIEELSKRDVTDIDAKIDFVNIKRQINGKYAKEITSIREDLETFSVFSTSLRDLKTAVEREIKEQRKGFNPHIKTLEAFDKIWSRKFDDLEDDVKAGFEKRKREVQQLSELNQRVINTQNRIEAEFEKIEDELATMAIRGIFCEHAVKKGEEIQEAFKKIKTIEDLRNIPEDFFKVEKLDFTKMFAGKIAKKDEL